VSEGRCACGAVRFRLTDKPVAVHCCHCSWCRRDSGAAFALNAWIETERVELTSGLTDRCELSTASGGTQTVVRCAACKVALWSHFSSAPVGAAMVRVGVLDDAASHPPDVHIFTADKLPWVVIPEGAEAFPAFYSGKDVPRIYGDDGAARWRALRLEG
jgi:hypothetical protein